jgi:Tfp pilus assembly protein PilO
MTYYNNHPDVKIYLELLLTLFAIIFLGIFAIKPTATTVASLSAELSQKLEVAKTLDIKIDGLNQAAQALEQNKDNLEILNGAVPTSPMVEDYIKQLEALAIKNGVQISDLEVDKTALVGAPVVQKDPSATEEEDSKVIFPSDAAAVPIKMTLTGPYISLKAYLSDIESHRRPMSISEITSNITEDELGTIRLSISGKVPYFYIPKEVNE